MNEFEHILLKKLIFSSEYFGKVLPILKSEYFANIGNQELFKLIKNYYNKYRDVPSLTELVGSVKNVSNSEIRSEIIDSLQTINKTEEVKNIEFMCDETVSWVKDAIYLKSLQVGSDGLMKKDENLKKQAKQLMEEMSKISIDTELGLSFDNIEDMIKYYQERNIGIRTQHKELNKRLGAGFLPGTLSIILAAAGIGKSLMGSDLLSGMLKNNKNILYISLEMQDKEVMKRVHANALGLPINSLIDLSKTESELEKITDRPVIDKEQVISAYNKLKTSGNCGKLYIKDYPPGTFSALMLEQLIESYKIEKNIEFDLVFLDYLGIAKSDLISPSAGLYSYVKSIAEEFRGVAKKMNIALLSASQLNRGSINNTETVDNSAVSDSVGTTQTADFMLFLLQDEEMKERNEIVCKCTKNRFTGRTDTWLMGIDYEHMRFFDMIVQNPMSNAEVSSVIGIENESAIDEDFGIITKEKQEKAEKFAKQEVNEILVNDVKSIKNHDKELNNSSDPFNENTDKIFAELGLI